MKKLWIVPLTALLLAATVCGGLFDIDETDSIGLCDKDTTTWNCIDGNPSGTVDYSVVNDKLDLDVHVDDIPCDTLHYQLTLNGAGDNLDNADTKLGNACGSPGVAASGYAVAWGCGLWGAEGFYNFHLDVTPQKESKEANCRYGWVKEGCKNVTIRRWRWGVGLIEKTTEVCDVQHPGMVCTDAVEFCFIDESYSLDLPVGVYEGVKFIVKEAGATPTSYPGPWTPVSMETEAMNFVIV